MPKGGSALGGAGMLSPLNMCAVAFVLYIRRPAGVIFMQVIMLNVWFARRAVGCSYRLPLWPSALRYRAILLWLATNSAILPPSQFSAILYLTVVLAARTCHGKRADKAPLHAVSARMLALAHREWRAFTTLCC